MPAIKPISDLRNYTEVLKEVDKTRCVYLTRNGRGVYAIMSIDDADEYQHMKAAKALVKELDAAKARADRDGWISEEEMSKLMEADD